MASELFPCDICSEVFFLHENLESHIESVHEEKKHSFLNSVSLNVENFDIPDEKLILDNFVKSYHKIDSEDMIIPDFDPEFKMAVNNEQAMNWKT